ERRAGPAAKGSSACPVHLARACLGGTAPAKAGPAVAHFRISLPYYLQRFPVTDELELGIDGDALVHVVSEGQGEVELLPGGKELVVHLEGQELQVKLDMDRATRKEVRGELEATPTPATVTQAPTHFAVDGRPAVV